jgi:hypothetical protein
MWPAFLDLNFNTLGREAGLAQNHTILSRFEIGIDGSSDARSRRR